MAPTDAHKWLKPTLFGVGLITALRILALWGSPTDLYVDESQYWIWGQSLDFGYYSKPPMIGWVLRLFDELAPARSAFTVRLPAPLFHGATAILMAAWAQSLAPSHKLAGLWVALAYLSLPIVAVGSFLISTDTIMAPFLVGALIMYWRLCAANATRHALLGGILLGAAFLSKYAAIYFLPCALLAYVIYPSMRPRLGSLALFFLAFIAAASPNILWNIANDLTTVNHTMDNAAWLKSDSAGANLSLARMIEFAASQFMVIGPVFMVFWLLALRGLTTSRQRALLWFSVPVWTIVLLQALLSRAYANWAFAAIPPATIAAILWALESRRVRALRLGFAFNLIICLILSLITLFPTWVKDGNGNVLAKRYVNVANITHEAMAVAVENNVNTIVALNRGILADFFFTGADSDFQFYSLPTQNLPHHYYQQKKSLPPEVKGRVLYVAHNTDFKCEGVSVTPVATLKQDIGSWANARLPAYIVDAECFR
ncbi:ArnT family glycosyltransferase [Pseudopelagicola sp. nBUS_20]|uniref:ArnT family glycosyltransferase n=1 Tax=Pseudopelagicola sp. nBUS_20 TaxID=3395317 RepID=UPI003EB93CAB